MARARTRFLFLMTLISLLGTLDGCYSLLGVKHNYTVSRKLKRGMSLDEALTVLNQGGRAVVQETLVSSPTQDRSLPPDDGPDRAPVRWWVEPEKSEIRKEVVVTRFWGFAGFGTFRLFFDGDGRLVSHDLEHVN